MPSPSNASCVARSSYTVEEIEDTEQLERFLGINFLTIRSTWVAAKAAHYFFSSLRR